MAKIFPGNIIISGKARGTGVSQRGGASDPGGTIILSGSYIAAIDTANDEPGLQVNLDVDGASTAWQLVTEDRQHELVQSSLVIPGATASNSILLTLPVATASGAVGNQWTFGVTARAVGSAAVPAVAAQQSYVDINAGSVGYVRITLNTSLVTGAAGNDWDLIYVIGTTATSVVVDETQRTVTVRIPVVTSATLTLSGLRDLINNDAGLSADLTATLVGNDGSLHTRSLNEIAGSQASTQTTASAARIDFHDGADAVAAVPAVAAQTIAFTVDSTARTLTLRAADGVDTLTEIATAINVALSGSAVVTPSGSTSFLSSQYFSSPPSQLTNFTGGLDLEVLGVSIDTANQEVQLLYDAAVDTLADIVTVIDATDGLSARLYAEVDGSQFPSAAGERVNFIVEVILSETDVRNLIGETSPDGTTTVSNDGVLLRAALADYLISLSRSEGLDDVELDVEPLVTVISVLAAGVGGTADGTTLTYTTRRTGYRTGSSFRYVTKFANTTTSPMLNVNGWGDRPLRKQDGTAFAVGEIKAGMVLDVQYSASPQRFYVVNVGDAVASGDSGGATTSFGFRDVAVESNGTYQLEDADAGVVIVFTETFSGNDYEAPVLIPRSEFSATPHSFVATGRLWGSNRNKNLLVGADISISDTGALTVSIADYANVGHDFHIYAVAGAGGTSSGLSSGDVDVRIANALADRGNVIDARAGLPAASADYLNDVVIGPDEKIYLIRVISGTPDQYVWELDDRATSQQVESLLAIIDRHSLQIDDLIQRASDLIGERVEEWATATDGEVGVVVSDSLNQNDINGINDWAAVYTTTFSSIDSDIVVRIPENANPSDYRVTIGANYTALVSAFSAIPQTLSGYDLYAAAVPVNNGDVITLEHHGIVTHTRYLGDLAKGVIDARDTGLPTATAENLNDIALEVNDNLSIVEKIPDPSTDGAGTWVEYDSSINANYLGDFGIAPGGTNGQFFFDRNDRKFYRYVLESGTVNLYRVNSPDAVLGANSVWLGYFSSEYNALHHIRDFDNTKTYYAFWGNAVRRLTNSSYTAPVWGTTPYLYEWISVGKATREQIEILEAALEIRLSQIEGNITDNTSRITTLETSGVSPGTSATADTEGDEVARTNALPTAATSAVLSPTWTVASVTGVSDDSGLLRVPKLRPSTPTMGFVVSAYEGDTKISDVFLPFGAVEPDPTGQIRAYDSKALRWDNGEIVLVNYYHDNTDGDTISLEGVNVALPATATVRVHLAVAAGGSSGGSMQEEAPPGRVSLATDLIQLTQWIRSSSVPATPAVVGYDGTTYTNFPDNRWSASRPLGTDPLYVATATLEEQEDGTWAQTLWVVTPENSARIEFFNATDGTYQDASSTGYITGARIWSVDRGWVYVPLVGTLELYSADLPSAGSEVSLPNIRLYRMDRLRFDFVDGNFRGTAEMSAFALFGENRSSLFVDTNVADRTVQNDQSLVFRFSTSGVCSVQMIGQNRVPTSAPSGYGVDGGFIFNLYANRSNELDKLSIVSRFGIADTTDATILKITGISG